MGLTWCVNSVAGIKARTVSQNPSRAWTTGQDITLHRRFRSPLPPPHLSPGDVGLGGWTGGRTGGRQDPAALWAGPAPWTAPEPLAPRPKLESEGSLYPRSAPHPPSHLSLFVRLHPQRRDVPLSGTAQSRPTYSSSGRALRPSGQISRPSLGRPPEKTID